MLSFPLPFVNFRWGLIACDMSSYFCASAPASCFLLLRKEKRIKKIYGRGPSLKWFVFLIKRFVCVCCQINASCHNPAQTVTSFVSTKPQVKHFVIIPACHRSLKDSVLPVPEEKQRPSRCFTECTVFFSFMAFILLPINKLQHSTPKERAAVRPQNFIQKRCRTVQRPQGTNETDMRNTGRQTDICFSFKTERNATYSKGWHKTFLSWSCLLDPLLGFHRWFVLGLFARGWSWGCFRSHWCLFWNLLCNSFSSWRHFQVFLTCFKTIKPAK